MRSKTRNAPWRRTNLPRVGPVKSRHWTAQRIASGAKREADSDYNSAGTLGACATYPAGAQPRHISRIFIHSSRLRTGIIRTANHANEFLFSIWHDDAAPR